MKDKFDLVLLIDDNQADNFFHEMVIEEQGLAREVVSIDGGAKALTYLSTPQDGSYPSPDLILLDINMPGMNGWEFLEKYETLENRMKAEVIVIMLTTSHDPKDLQKAESLSNTGVAGLKNKPLTPEMLQEVLMKHF